MNQDCLGSAPSKPPRKVRFAPKAPPRKDQKPILPKAEKVEDADTAQEELMRRLYNEASMKGKSKFEKKSAHTQVAFGFGGASSMRSYGPTKGGINRSQGGVASFKDMKEYKEPWNYYSYYPVTLPLRRPYSGNPELLDEEEFREASETTTYNENSTNAAEELGLMEDNLEASMFLLKLPDTMPLLKQPVKTEDQEVAGSSKPLKGAGSSTKTCSLNELPPGYMGKMLVYRSGAVKLKLGDTLYDVSLGLDSVFAQDVVAINMEEKKHCCVLGELNKRATIIPDVEYAFANMPEL
ncbi:hypothetical protein LguiB_021562 [Lonicera macranthoides]